MSAVAELRAVLAEEHGRCLEAQRERDLARGERDEARRRAERLEERVRLLELGLKPFAERGAYVERDRTVARRLLYPDQR